MTERWAAAKTAAINSVNAVRTAQAEAQARIKASCGQDAWRTEYLQPWAPLAAEGYSSLAYNLTTGRYNRECHWECTLREVEALPSTLAPWATPERWEALWAEQQG